MSGMLNCTAAGLRAILCFIDAQNTPKIAFDNDSLAIPLANKIKEALGNRDGSQSVYISWNEEDSEIVKQFHGVCKNIKSVFDQLEYCKESYTK